MVNDRKGEDLISDMQMSIGPPGLHETINESQDSRQKQPKGPIDGGSTLHSEKKGGGDLDLMVLNKINPIHEAFGS